MDELRQWHRLFGMSWTDFFTGLPVTVEMEKDLSLKQQLLDVVLIKKGAAALPCRLPDGFEDLAAHNLVSFKSYQETLDGWTLNELVGHYVNYRKQASPSMQELLPEGDFRLFAVSVRYPQGLAQQMPLERVQEGVYAVRHFTGPVRIVVVHQLPRQEHNAMLHLFSAKAELVRYGAQHYQPRSDETSTFLHQLFARYQREGLTMPYTKEEFIREALEEILESLPVEKRLKGLSAEQRLEGKSPEEFVKELSPEMRAALLRYLKAADSSASPS
jgi:hypothetical protein